MHTTLLGCIIETRKYNYRNTYLLVNHTTRYLCVMFLPTIGTLPCSYSLEEVTPMLGISFLHQVREYRINFITSLSEVLTTDHTLLVLKHT